MLALAISTAVLAVCLAASIVISYRERKFLIGLLASKDYADFKMTEEGGTNREYRSPFTRRAKKEKSDWIESERRE